jgi:hypothetical protein
VKTVFAIGIVGLIVLEISLVYFIMPLPGSQRMQSIDVAYQLYSWRWPLRAVFAGMILGGTLFGWRTGGARKWVVPASLVLVAVVAYMTNFRMAADRIFLPPTVLSMQPASRNTVATDRLVVGVAIEGAARAYPLQFIGYHHQVRDTIAGQPIMVSYCTVCRTGRVFRPVVDRQVESFRLVGMDHFNAMFEDQTTKSWWRQATGEAVAGPHKGKALAEVPSQQVTLARWLSLHPGSLIMQGDSTFADEYAKDYAFEKGTSRKKLTGTDTASWNDKSWIVGVTLNNESKAYDWNRLRRERVVNDEVGGTPIVLALASDTTSFFAFVRPNDSTTFTIRGDSLISPSGTYALTGTGSAGALKPVKASQEFWHSWRTFQPRTGRY